MQLLKKIFLGVLGLTILVSDTGCPMRRGCFSFCSSSRKQEAVGTAQDVSVAPEPVHANVRAEATEKIQVSGDKKTDVKTEEKSDRQKFDFESFFLHWDEPIPTYAKPRLFIYADHVEREGFGPMKEFLRSQPIETRKKLVNASYCGEKLLIRFARLGYREGIEILCENGADVKVRDEDGKTAMYWACTKSESCVKVLLAHGCNVSEDSLLYGDAV